MGNPRSPRVEQGVQSCTKVWGGVWTEESGCCSAWEAFEGLDWGLLIATVICAATTTVVNAAGRTTFHQLVQRTRDSVESVSSRSSSSHQENRPRLQVFSALVFSPFNISYVSSFVETHLALCNHLLVPSVVKLPSSPRVIR